MRNPSITIVKAIAIVLVVLVQSGCPTPVSSVSAMLCASLFFLCSGYCLKPEYFDAPSAFVGRRFKKLYLPFVLWSMVFLLLNRFWFATGILNEQYGNAAGGITHPLDLHNTLQNTWSIIFNMSGYDPFLCEVFWFFRALLVSSIACFVFVKLIESTRWFRGKFALSAVIVALLALGFVFWQISDGLKVTGLAEGGYREFMGIFFFAAGFTYRRLELWLNEAPFDEDYEDIMDPANDEYETADDEEAADGASTSRVAQMARQGGGFIASFAGSSLRVLCASPFVTVPIALGILAATIYFGTPALTPSTANFTDPLLLAVGSVAAFSLLYNLSGLLQRIPKLNKTLEFIGENTLYVLLFHLLAFKLVSMVKVGAYHLPWEMIGSHPTVVTEEGTWFWTLYFIVGLALPLGIVWAIKYCAANYNIDNYVAFIKACGRAIIAAAIFTAHWVSVGSVFLAHWTWKGLRWLFVESWASIYNFCIRFVDTVKDGADINQDSDDDEDDDDDAEEYEEEDDEEDDDEEEE